MYSKQVSVFCWYRAWQTKRACAASGGACVLHFPCATAHPDVEFESRLLSVRAVLGTTAVLCKTRVSVDGYHTSAYPPTPPLFSTKPARCRFSEPFHFSTRKKSPNFGPGPRHCVWICSLRAGDPFSFSSQFARINFVKSTLSPRYAPPFSFSLSLSCVVQ